MAISRSSRASPRSYYLGAEYPYILKHDALSSVVEMIDYAKASFGGHELASGLEIMKSVRQGCDPKQIENDNLVGLSRSRCYVE